MAQQSSDVLGTAASLEDSSRTSRQESFTRKIVSTNSARAGDRAVENPQSPSAKATEVVDTSLLASRLDRVERQNRWMKYTLLVLVLVVGYFTFEVVFPNGVVVHKTLLESKELKLLDSKGQTRLFLRMYSRVPVLQVLDTQGKPRMSLGLRFDDTPFIDLSDKTGRTRATFEMTAEDSPALRLFDENGDISFKIN